MLLSLGGVGVVFKASFPAWGRRVLLGSSFAARWPLEAVRRGRSDGVDRRGGPRRYQGVMKLDDPAPTVNWVPHAARGERCGSRTVMGPPVKARLKLPSGRSHPRRCCGCRGVSHLFSDRAVRLVAARFFTDSMGNTAPDASPAW